MQPSTIGLTGLLLWLVTSWSLVEATESDALTAEQWSADLDAMSERIESTHPKPWRKLSRSDWRSGIQSIRLNAGAEPASHTAARMMALVARLGDTHTNLWPSARVGFDLWFPLRLYEFTDGYFITAIHRDHARLAGARVLAIDGTPIAEAADRARSLRSSENEFGHRAGLHYLSSAPALSALGVTRHPRTMKLELVDQDGNEQTLVLGAMEGHPTLAWSQWGEMFGPLFEDRRTLVTAFDGLSPIDFRDASDQRSLHLRYRGRYRYWHLPDRAAIFAQINFLVDDDDDPFEDGFMRRLFDAVDETRVQKLIIDLRYNGGGDGSMAIPFVHELIKRDGSTGLNGVNQPGRLFVLVGRKTFSAGVGLLDQLVDHTHAMLVGEPPRSPFNHYGDPTSMDLPNSGMRLDVSNRYWQFALSDDTRTTIPIHYPARFSASDYFSGRDPAVDAILAGKVQPLPTLIREQGAEAALALIDSVIANQGQPEWWIPFDRRIMRHTGRDLVKVGRLDDGITAYRLNARFHGESWRVWDSLGDGLKAAGDRNGAIAAYERALALKADNWNADHQRRMIAELNGSVRPAADQ